MSAVVARDDATAARCLRRGLKVLAELNRRRMAGAAEIGTAIGVPRPTVHRLLLALTADGYVRPVAGTEFFVAQTAVTALSAGWDATARALDLATRQVDEIAGTIGWPIDLTVFDKDAMIVRHSTHDRVGWSLLPRSPVGHRLPLIGTAPGRMYLAGLGPVARRPHLSSCPAEELDAIDKAGQRRFAVRDGGILPRTTSIAVPVWYRDETLLCISMAFIRATTVLDEMIATHVPTLSAIADSTEHMLDDADGLRAGRQIAVAAG